MESRPELPQLRTTSFTASSHRSHSPSHKFPRKRDRTPFPDGGRKTSVVSTAPSTPVTGLFSIGQTPCQTRSIRDSISTEDSEKSQPAVNPAQDYETSESVSLKSDVEPDSEETKGSSIRVKEEKDTDSTRKPQISCPGSVELKRQFSWQYYLREWLYLPAETVPATQIKRQFSWQYYLREWLHLPAETVPATQIKRQFSWQYYLREWLHLPAETVPATQIKQQRSHAYLPAEIVPATHIKQQRSHAYLPAEIVPATHIKQQRSHVLPRGIIRGEGERERKPEVPEYQELIFRPPFPSTINCSINVEASNAVLPGLSIPVDELAYRHDGSLGLSCIVSKEISKRMVREGEDEGNVQNAFVRYISNKWVDDSHKDSDRVNSKPENLAKSGSSLKSLAIPTKPTSDSTSRVEVTKSKLPVLDRIVIPGSGPRIEFPEAIITATELKRGRCCLSIAERTASQYMENATLWLPEEESVLYDYRALSSLPRQDGTGVIHESGVGVDIVRQHIRLGRWIWILNSKGEIDVLRTAAFYEAKRLHLGGWTRPLERFSNIDQSTFDYVVMGKLSASLSKKIEASIAAVGRAEARASNCGSGDVGDLSNPFLGPQNEVAVKTKAAVAERERLALQDQALEEFREEYEARSRSSKISHLIRHPRSELSQRKMLRADRQPTPLEIHLARLDAKYAAIDEVWAPLVTGERRIRDNEEFSFPPPEPFVTIEMEKPTRRSRRDGKKKATGQGESSYIGAASSVHPPSLPEREKSDSLELQWPRSRQTVSWDWEHQSSPPKGSAEYELWVEELNAFEPPSWLQCPRPMGKTRKLSIVPRDTIRRKLGSPQLPPEPVRLEHVIAKIMAEDWASAPTPTPTSAPVPVPVLIPQANSSFWAKINKRLQVMKKMKVVEAEAKIEELEKQPVMPDFGNWREAWLGVRGCHIS